MALSRLPRTQPRIVRPVSWICQRGHQQGGIYGVRAAALVDVGQFRVARSCRIGAWSRGPRAHHESRTAALRLGRRSGPHRSGLSLPSSTSTRTRGATDAGHHDAAAAGPRRGGNEPHHVGLSRDGRTLALGGLLSVLKGPARDLLLRRLEPDVAALHLVGRSAAVGDHRRVLRASPAAASWSR